MSQERVRRFVEAFNSRDLQGFVATLHPEVEIHGNRGLRRGIAEAREWATRAPGGVQQRIEIEELQEVGDLVLALIVREWWWEEGEGEDELAGRDAMAWLFRLEDGLVREWRPFEEREEALRAVAANDR